MFTVKALHCLMCLYHQHVGSQSVIAAAVMVNTSALKSVHERSRLVQIIGPHNEGGHHETMRLRILKSQRFDNNEPIMQSLHASPTLSYSISLHMSADGAAPRRGENERDPSISLILQLPMTASICLRTV